MFRSDSCFVASSVLKKKSLCSDVTSCLRDYVFISFVSFLERTHVLFRFDLSLEKGSQRSRIVTDTTVVVDWSMCPTTSHAVLLWLSFDAAFVWIVAVKRSTLTSVSSAIFLSLVCVLSRVCLLFWICPPFRTVSRNVVIEPSNNKLVSVLLMTTWLFRFGICFLFIGCFIVSSFHMLFSFSLSRFVVLVNRGLGVRKELLDKPVDRPTQ